MWPLLIFGFVLFFGGVAQLFGFGHPQGWDYFWAIGEIVVGAACLSAGGLGGIVDEPEHKDKGRPYQEPPAGGVDWDAALDRALRDYRNDGIVGAAWTIEMFVKNDRPQECKKFCDAIGLDATNEAIRWRLAYKRKNAPMPSITSTRDLNDWLNWKQGKTIDPRFGD